MARVNFGSKPLMYPMPVLIVGTYDENGVPNAMNAAWGCMYDFDEVFISVSEYGHLPPKYSYALNKSSYVKV